MKWWSKAFYQLSSETVENIRNRSRFSRSVWCITVRGFQVRWDAFQDVMENKFWPRGPQFARFVLHYQFSLKHWLPPIMEMDPDVPNLFGNQTQWFPGSIICEELIWGIESSRVVGLVLLGCWAVELDNSESCHQVTRRLSSWMFTIVGMQGLWAMLRWNELGVFDFEQCFVGIHSNTVHVQFIHEKFPQARVWHFVCPTWSSNFNEAEFPLYQLSRVFAMMAEGTWLFAPCSSVSTAYSRWISNANENTCSKDSWRIKDRLHIPGRPVGT